MVYNLSFYTVASMIVVQCALIPLFRNLIYSVFSLLCIILIIVCTLFSLNVYYISLTFLIIYAGAIIILFLFLIITIIKNYKFTSEYTLIVPNAFFLTIFWLFYTLFLGIISSDSLLFLNLSRYSAIDLFIFNLNYYLNDINIVSAHLFSSFFEILLLVIFLLFFVLLAAIFISKKGEFKEKTWTPIYKSTTI